MYRPVTSSDMTSPFHGTLEKKKGDPNFMLAKFYGHCFASLRFIGISFTRIMPLKISNLKKPKNLRRRAEDGTLKSHLPRYPSLLDFFSSLRFFSLRILLSSDVSSRRDFSCFFDLSRSRSFSFRSRGSRVLALLLSRFSRSFLSRRSFSKTIF